MPLRPEIRSALRESSFSMLQPPCRARSVPATRRDLQSETRRVIGTGT